MSNLEEIAATCREQIAAGMDSVSLVLNPGCSTRGLGFGRGELLCQQPDGSRVYRFRASRVLAALPAQGGGSDA